MLPWGQIQSSIRAIDAFEERIPEERCMEHHRRIAAVKPSELPEDVCGKWHPASLRNEGRDRIRMHAQKGAKLNIYVRIATLGLFGPLNSSVV